MDAFEKSLNDLLVKIYRSLETLEEATLRASHSIPLSISEIHLLEAAGQVEGQSASISDISERLGISLPSVTLAVNKLEKKGYVSRAKCSSDGRVVRVDLTRLGQRARRAHRYFYGSMVRASAAGLTPQERSALLSGVEKLDAFLDENIKKYRDKE